MLVKTFSFILFCFYSLNAFGQKNLNADTIYYLLDTTKTPANDRMWDSYRDEEYRTYSIQCPCLKFNGKPTFSYSNRDKGRVLARADLKKIKLSNLSALILRSKQFLDKDGERDPDHFFLIEPERGKYIVHEAVLYNPAIRIVSGPDVISYKPDTSAFAVKGLIQINPNNLAKYIKKPIITTGKIVNTKVIDSTNTVLLLAGIDNINQGFTILIRSENRNNFDQPEFVYKGKKIKVTGKVIEYEEKPAIEISDPKQIQILVAK